MNGVFGMQDMSMARTAAVVRREHAAAWVRW